MTNNVPGIGINTNSPYPYTGQPKANNPAPKENPTVKPETEAPPSVAPDDVFAYMASSAPVTVPKVYDVSKYVSPEQAARIAEMMGKFEGAVQQGLLLIEEEGLPLSEEDKLALAAAMVD